MFTHIDVDMLFDSVNKGYVSVKRKDVDNVFEDFFFARQKVIPSQRTSTRKIKTLYATTNHRTKSLA